MIGWRILLWAVLVLSALLFLYLVRGILPPFIIAFVIASLLEPSIKKLRNRGIKRIWAVSLVFVLFFTAIGTIAVVSAPRLADQVVELRQTVVDLTESLTRQDPSDNFFLKWNPVVQARNEQTPDRVDSILMPYRGTLERFGLPSTRHAIMQEYVEPYRGRIAQLVATGVTTFLGILADLPAHIIHLLLIPLLTFLILMDLEDFKQRSQRYIPPSLRAGTIRLFEDIGDVFMRYMRGVAQVVLWYTISVTLLLTAMGVPYSILLGLLFGALYLIPYIGNIIAYVVVFLVVGLSGAKGNLVFELANPWTYALLVTVMFVAVAFVFDHWFYPSKVGASVGLNAVVSLFVVFCGAALFGIAGMILAYPLAGSVKVILDRLLRITTTATDELALPAVPLRHRASTTG